MRNVFLPISPSLPPISTLHTLISPTLCSVQVLVHLEFLLSNPDVMIHYGFSRQNKPLSHTLQSLRYFDFVGINQSRLVSGPVVAGQVLVPREGGCQDASYNAWELRAARRKLKDIADALVGVDSGVADRKAGVGVAKTNASRDSENLSLRIVLIHRTVSTYSQNLFDVKRRWSRQTLLALMMALQGQFPHAIIDVFSDGNSTLMKCIRCQIQLFSSANLVIGVRLRLFAFMQ